METLLHHMKPYTQKSLSEAEERIEKRVSQQTKQKILAVHQ